MKQDQSTTILNILMLSIAIILSGNVFAQKTKKPATATVYEIGKTGPAGGIVFHISDGGGSRVRGHHGLEAAPADLGDAPWGCLIVSDIPGAQGNKVGSGAQNTLDILAGCKELDIAAELASNYELNGYSDWFLPSVQELKLMREKLYLWNRSDSGFGFHEYHYYWSSTEFNDVFFSIDPDQLPRDPTAKDTPQRVRAIRAF